MKLTEAGKRFAVGVLILLAVAVTALITFGMVIRSRERAEISVQSARPPEEVMRRDTDAPHNDPWRSEDKSKRE